MTRIVQHDRRTVRIAQALVAIWGLLALGPAATLAVAQPTPPQRDPAARSQPDDGDRADDGPDGDGADATDDGQPAEANPLQRYYRENNVYQGPDLLQEIRAGNTAMRTGRFDAAQAAFERAVGLSEDKDVVAMHKAGLAMFARGQFVRAAQMVRAAIGRFPAWTRFAWDVPEQFGSIGRQTLQQQMRELASSLEGDDADNADLWFLLGYLQYYSVGAQPEVDDIMPALRAFHRAVELNDSDSASREFIRTLAARGVQLEDAPEPRDYDLPTDRAWLRAGLRQLHRRDYARAAMAFGAEGMRTFSGEAWLWMAVALIADGKSAHGAEMLRRGLLSAWEELEKMPAATDLMPSTVHEARMRTLKTRASGGDTRAAVSAGFIAFLDGDVETARELLMPVANLEPTPDDPESPARFGPAARWMMKYLPRRANPPRLNLEDVVSADADTGDGEPGTEPDVGSDGDTHTGDSGTDITPEPEPGTQPDPDAGTGDTDPGGDTDGTGDGEPAARTEADVQREVGRLLDRGDDALTGGDFTEAYRFYDLAERAGTSFRADWFDSPIRADLHLRMARAHFGLGAFGKSGRSLTRYLGAIPEPARRAQRAFEAPFDDDQFGAQLRTLTRHVRRTPGDRDARLLLAYLQFSQGEYLDSWQHFTQLATGDDVDPVVLWFLSLLRSDPFNVEQLDPATRAANMMAEGRELMAEELYETAVLEFQRAYELTPTDEVVTHLLAALWARTSQPDYTPNDRVEGFKRIAQTLRSHLLNRGRANWINTQLDFNEALGTVDLATTCRRVLKHHVSNKPLDFNAWYFAGFVHYFDEDWSEALRAFASYQATTRDQPTEEFEFFRAGARVSGRRGTD